MYKDVDTCLTHDSQLSGTANVVSKGGIMAVCRGYRRMHSERIRKRETTWFIFLIIQHGERVTPASAYRDFKADGHLSILLASFHPYNSEHLHNTTNHGASPSPSNTELLKLPQSQTVDHRNTRLNTYPRNTTRTPEPSSSTHNVAIRRKGTPPAQSKRSKKIKGLNKATP